MLGLVEAGGHPRDMGHAQGRAQAAAVRDALARAGLVARRSRTPSLRAFASGPTRGTGSGRETIRHYAHLAERIDGLARGADVSTDAILALHARAAALGSGEEETRAAVAIAALGLDDSPGASVARSLPGVPNGGGGLIVRRSRPAVGFESVEVTLAWLVSALAGVNDAGLAACLVALPEPADRSRSAPAPILLVQDCLQRFASVGAAVDWASSRPVWGGGTLLLADADGARAAVHFSGGERRVETAVDAPLVAGRPERLVDALAQAAASERTLDEKALCPPHDDAATASWVRLIPTRRSLELRRPGPPRLALQLEA